MRDGGQCHIGHRGIEYRNGDRQKQGQGGPMPPGRFQTVGEWRCLACCFDHVQAFLVGRFQDSRVFCVERDNVSLSAGASLVSVVPAPSVAPRPTRTGATNWLSEPIKASSSITVRCLLTPS